MAAWTSAAIIYICRDPRRRRAEYRARAPGRRQALSTTTGPSPNKDHPHMTRFASRFSAIAVSFAVLLSIDANAQWSADPSNNLVIADSDNEQVQPKIVPTADGGFYVSWFDNSTGGLRCSPATARRAWQRALAAQRHSRRRTRPQLDRGLRPRGRRGRQRTARLRTHRRRRARSGRAESRAGTAPLRGPTTASCSPTAVPMRRTSPRSPTAASRSRGRAAKARSSSTNSTATAIRSGRPASRSRARRYSRSAGSRATPTAT